MLTDLLRLQFDLLGAHTELAANLLGGGLLSRLAPGSDTKAPVISIPGFMASEATLLRLNRFLKQQGFNARSWGLGRNLGPQGTGWNQHLDKIGNQLKNRVMAMADETSAPVALIGQSLGGVYARELALRLEEEIDRVIMLGAPTFHPYKEDRHNRVIGTFGYWFNRQTASEFAGRDGLLHWESDRPALPCVAIHSPIDGIVDENACHIPGYIVKHSGRKAPRENIRVLSSHIGMCVNPWVLLAVADRLVADRDHWRAFAPQDYFPGFLDHAASWLYPDADGLWQDKGTASFLEMNLEP
jgi:pimeloyl-ACP methyl ester carboxylesterase